MTYRKFSLFWMGVAFSGSGFAAAFEQSSQSIQILFYDQNYVEMSAAHIQPDVTGKIVRTESMFEDGIQDDSTGQLVKDQWGGNASVKLQVAPDWSIAILYDRPFGMDAQYYYQPTQDHQHQFSESATIQFNSHTLSTVVGFQPTVNWHLYSGVALQRFSGELGITGVKYDFLDGYQVHFKPETSFGWLAGISYSIPEYYFRASLTYRSPIQHKHKTEESIETGLSQSDYSTIRTPESVNLDFNTGLSTRSFAYVSLRWVNWPEFVVQPPELNVIAKLAALDLHLIDYQDQQWSGKVGLGYRLYPNWTPLLEYLWDSGTGNPASTLNPSDGYWGIGLGHLYKIQETWDIATGLYYLKFQKPKISTSESITSQISGLSAISDNSAWIVGLKLGYHF